MDELTHTKWSIRRAIADDRKAISQLQKRLHRPPRSDSAILEYIVAESDSTIIGCAAVRKRDGLGYLYGLVVDKPWRRKGVGHALTQQRLDWLRDENVRSVFVMAMFWNIKFFKKHRFVLVKKEESRGLARLHRDFIDQWSNRSALLFLRFSSRPRPAQDKKMSIRSRKPEVSASLQIRGADWLKLRPKAREAVVERAFRFWRNHGFPFYRLSPHQIRQDVCTLLAKDPHSVFDGKDLRTSNSGLRLANSFQPRMWSTKVNRYLSPIQVFRDNTLLRKAIERSFRIWPDRSGASASCIRRILKTYPGAASVSNYRPMIAKAIMSRYCPEGGTVVDFAAGYGGRLLGAIAARRNYIGIEPNRAQMKGFLKMSETIKAQGFDLPSLKFLNGTAETELPRFERARAQLVFSSPPFFDWEHYSRSNSQSFRRYPKYEAWLGGFLRPVIEQSYRILKRSGYLALNVTNGNRLPTPADVANIAIAAGFQLPTVHEMVFPKVPYLHPRDRGPVKRELIMIFRK